MGSYLTYTIVLLLLTQQLAIWWLWREKRKIRRIMLSTQELLTTTTERSNKLGENYQRLKLVLDNIGQLSKTISGLFL